MRPVRHAFVRALLALLALVTSAAPAAAAVGEGVLASHAGRSPVVAHVEDARQAQCPYVHADDCALCAVLGAVALPGAVALAPARATVACRVAVPVRAGTRPARRSPGTRHARGPPTG